MNSRTCPNCGNKTSRGVYYRKYLFKFLDSKWDCEKCGSQLTFNVGRRTLVAVISMAPIGFTSLIVSYLQTDLFLTKGLSYFVFVLIFLLWALFIYSFDSFELLNRKQEI